MSAVHSSSVGTPFPLFGAERRHRLLAELNRGRLAPRLDGPNWRSELRADLRRRELEGEMIEDERRSLAPLLVDLPTGADDFMQWYEALRETGPGQNDPLFPWLSAHAGLAPMRWFLSQEVAGEAGFDDLVALTQLRFGTRAKLELARNYWDEMGRGRADAMHGPMLEATVEELQLCPDPEMTVWESLAVANTMLALADNRRYAYQSLGALGVIELTAPGRVACVNEGLRRLGVSAPGRRYFQIHASLDVRHSLAWNREIIRPLVAADPRTALPIAEGALLRLRAGARCFVRYRQELGC